MSARGSGIRSRASDPKVGTTFEIDPVLHFILEVRIMRAGNRVRAMR